MPAQVLCWLAGLCEHLALLGSGAMCAPALGCVHFGCKG